MHSSRLNQLIISIFLVGVALLVQFRLTNILGLHVNVALAALIALSFFTRFLNLVFLSLFGIVGLTWRPGITPEMVAMFFLPITVFFARKFLPGKQWLNNAIFLFTTLFIFHLISNFSSIASHFGALFLDVVVGTLIGMLIFQALDYAYRPTTKAE